MDDVGIDSIEGAVLMSVAMEAGILPWGDGKGTYRLIDEDIRKGTPLGRAPGNGTGSVGRSYGLTRIPVVKNQAIPAYDPRAVKGIGVTYATSTMGADHTSGYSIMANILKVGGFVDPLQKEGQVELSRNSCRLQPPCWTAPVSVFSWPFRCSTCLKPLPRPGMRWSTPGTA